MKQKIDTSNWPRDKDGNPYWYNDNEAQNHFRFLTERETEAHKAIVEDNIKKRQYGKHFRRNSRSRNEVC